MLRDEIDGCKKLGSQLVLEDDHELDIQVGRFCDLKGFTYIQGQYDIFEDNEKKPYEIGR